MPNIFQPEKISLLNNSEISEAVIQQKIAENPSILGLGDLVLKDKERIQPRAGRLDLLLQDPDTQRRYEVEIQLGKTDESHIIRTIEYWDTERKRYPQYDHCAVIVAEDITTRFNNMTIELAQKVAFLSFPDRLVTIGRRVHHDVSGG